MFDEFEPVKYELDKIADNLEGLRWKYDIDLYEESLTGVQRILLYEFQKDVPLHILYRVIFVE